MPVHDGPVSDRWPGVALLVVAVALGAIGKLSAHRRHRRLRADPVGRRDAADLVRLAHRASSSGRRCCTSSTCCRCPGVLYYKLSAFLQMISSELGVWFLHLIDVPVFLEGNIIDLGVLKLHVAEACSGLRYLFPILSFSYIFAVLYRGPMWHKAVLLLGRGADHGADELGPDRGRGLDRQQLGHRASRRLHPLLRGLGDLHDLRDPAVPAGLAAAVLPSRRGRRSSDALDLEMSGLPAQAARLRYVRASAAMILSALILGAGALAWQLRPEVEKVDVLRDPFALFPRQLGDWSAAAPDAASARDRAQPRAPTTTIRST